MRGFVIAVLASLVVGYAWIWMMALAFDAGYWSGPVRWPVAVGGYAALVTVPFLRRPLFAAAAGASAAGASIVGGLCAVVTLIVVYGTGT